MEGPKFINIEEELMLNSLLLTTKGIIAIFMEVVSSSLSTDKTIEIFYENEAYYIYLIILFFVVIISVHNSINAFIYIYIKLNYFN
jgi:hypothetical protein